MPREFKGKAGTIYLQTTDDNDAHRYEAWFEDFCIIGAGPTEEAALEDAVRHTMDMHTLAEQALAELRPPQPYKGPINQPCSACSAGDTAMEYHDHDYVKPENRRPATQVVGGSGGE